MIIFLTRKGGSCWSKKMEKTIYQSNKMKSSSSSSGNSFMACPTPRTPEKKIFALVIPVSWKWRLFLSPRGSILDDCLVNFIWEGGSFADVETTLRHLAQNFTWLPVEHNNPNSHKTSSFACVLFPGSLILRSYRDKLDRDRWPHPGGSGNSPRRHIKSRGMYEAVKEASPTQSWNRWADFIQLIP